MSFIGFEECRAFVKEQEEAQGRPFTPEERNLFLDTWLAEENISERCRAYYKAMYVPYPHEARSRGRTRCTLHKVTFGRLGSCAQCEKERGYRWCDVEGMWVPFYLRCLHD